MSTNPQRWAVSPADVHEQCYCLNAQRAARRMARLYDEGLRPLALNQGQFSLLMVVAGLQPVNVGVVADELVMDRTTVTAAVKPLERRGLLQTTPSATDQRQRLLSVTAAGQALLVQAARSWQALQAAVQDQLLRAAPFAADRTRKRAEDQADNHADIRADLRRLAATKARPLSPPRDSARRSPKASP